MDVLTQMKAVIIEAVVQAAEKATHLEAEKATHLVQMNTAERAGWVLADYKFVSHIQGIDRVSLLGKVTRKHAIVCGFAHEATGRMWVTTVYYRTDTVDHATRTQVYSEDPCADPELHSLLLQAWANLYSAMSCK